ncbi:MAG: NADH-quinone oxidoreductase subunit N [bacterium]
MNEISLNAINLLVVSPAIALTLTGFLIIGLGLLFPRMLRGSILSIALVGLAVSFLLTFRLWDSYELAFGGMVTTDNFALVFNCIFFLGAVLSLLLSCNEHEGSYLLYPEFFAIVLFATVGMIFMASGTNLLTIFLGLETLSISLYILAGFKRTESRSLEAAFKYFLLGAFASGFLLYGIALIFGATGSLDLGKIGGYVASNPILSDPLMILGGLLVIVGFGFKVAMFPFHMWAPDVYQGAPTPITAFMATGSKAAGFAAMLRVLSAATNGGVADWVNILWVLSVITMFVGNITAIVQVNVKRMLAYSSIAHAGYILVGIVAWNQMGNSSVIFYLLSYTFMNIGAFGVISILGTKEKEFLELDDFKGLGYHRPVMAVVMSIFMFSLAGLPPTAGFVGKFYLFSAAVKAGHIPLVVIGVINSMISLYYYLGVVVVMFMKDAEREMAPGVPVPAVSLSLLVAVFGTFGLGIFPSRWMETFQQLVGQMMQ